MDSMPVIPLAERLVAVAKAEAEMVPFLRPAKVDSAQD